MLSFSQTPFIGKYGGKWKNAVEDHAADRGTGYLLMQKGVREHAPGYDAKRLL